MNLIPPATVTALERAGKQYATLQKLTSRKEWYLGNFVNGIWQSLPMDAREELTMDNFYMECSSHINALLDFPVVGDSGRTLRFWCETAAYYETFPNVETWKEVLSFDHFRRAKKLAADPTNNVTSDRALALAVQNHWVASEMEAELSSKRILSLQEIELQQRYPKWAWQTSYAMIGLNGSFEAARTAYDTFVGIVERERTK